MAPSRVENRAAAAEEEEEAAGSSAHEEAASPHRSVPVPAANARAARPRISGQRAEPVAQWTLQHAVGHASVHTAL